MQFSFSKTFEKQLQNLPPEVRATFVKQKKILEENPRHPSLHTKKLKDFESTYSIRIGRAHRALFIIREHDGSIIFFAVGHRKDIYR